MSTVALTSEMNEPLPRSKFLNNLKQMLPALYTQFWLSSQFALMAPFFPNFAESKGLKASEYGYIFSMFKFAMLIGSITSEIVMRRISPTTVYISGVLGQFLFGIALGSLYWCPPGPHFIVLAMIISAFGGHTGTWYSVSMYGIVTERFSAKIGIILSSMEFFWGLGNMFGSTIGGVLVDYGGFPLPYGVLGTIMILAMPIIFKKGPAGNKSKTLTTSDATDKQVQVDDDISYRRLLLKPMFLISMINIIFSWVIMGFNEPTLEPYLRKQFNMNQTQVGLIFMVQFGSYAFGAIICGLMWHFKCHVFFLFFGQTLTAVSFLIQGPSFLLNLEPSVTLVVLSQVCTGIGMAAQFVCGFANALQVAVDAGHPDNLQTTGKVSSWTFTALVLGAIVTPPLAAKAVDSYGYRKGTIFIMVPLAVWSVVDGVAWIYVKFRRSSGMNLVHTGIHTHGVVNYQSDEIKQT